MIHWNQIESTDAFDRLIEASFEKPIAIFKHSRSCGVSALALKRFEKEFHSDKSVAFYMVNVKTERNISNYIAQILSVKHESPQLLLIKNGEVHYSDSHMRIKAEQLENCLSLISNN